MPVVVFEDRYAVATADLECRRYIPAHCTTTAVPYRARTYNLLPHSTERRRIAIIHDDPLDIPERLAGHVILAKPESLRPAPGSCYYTEHLILGRSFYIWKTGKNHNPEPTGQRRDWC